MMARSRSSVATAALLLVALLMVDPTKATYEFEQLEQDIQSHGGTVNTKVAIGSNGIRSLVANASVAKGGYLAIIPASLILDAGGPEDLMVPIMSYLREAHDPSSRFRSYIDTMPPPGSVINWCTISMEHVKILQSDYWTRTIEVWQRYISAAWAGDIESQLEVTFPEIGDTPITLSELRHACALVNTRSLLPSATNPRFRMIPLFKMSSHKLHCPHTTSLDVTTGDFHLIAGRDVEPGEEICSDYGALRDEDFVFHHGFLPGLRYPLPLHMSDHHHYTPGMVMDADNMAKLHAPFAGTQEELSIEIDRLWAVMNSLWKAFPSDTSEPGSLDSKSYALVLELKSRRMEAVSLEIGRLKDMLAPVDKEEL